MHKEKTQIKNQNNSGHNSGEAGTSVAAVEQQHRRRLQVRRSSNIDCWHFVMMFVRIHKTLSPVAVSGGCRCRIVGG
ncbi:hypothetical protein HanIR_Chr02g0072051 [Helianthus annuus]|nr:hypothetical protein HanIR_Chr02g0072051 [Helianthus annuus]